MEKLLYLDPDEPYNITCYITDLTENQKQHFIDISIKIEENDDEEYEEFEGHHYKYKYYIDGTYDEAYKIEDYLFSKGFKCLGPASTKGLDYI